MSAVTAGIIFCMCGFYVALPKGVSVNGLDVGGLTYKQAAAAVRGEIEEKLKSESLIISGKKAKYEFTFPEISYKDNLSYILKNCRRGDSYTVDVSYYICGMDEVISKICNDERVRAVEPYAQFRSSGIPFVYNAGSDGLEPNSIKLKKDVLESLKGGFEKVMVEYTAVKRSTTVEQVIQNTRLLGSFSTVYDSSNLNRSSNIRLAAEMLNGVTVGAGEELSFNQSVGERSPERGFLPAKIIENGEYTEGVGGGVCQVSTTLYNAALLSGLSITEFHPHSLPVGYVNPSRDAMVSGGSCDLKIKNPSGFPVYIRAQAVNGVLDFKIYGRSDGAKYSIESVVTGNLPAPEEQCADPSLARAGKDGILSEGYLLINRDGYIKRVKLRSDRYSPQKRLVYVEPEGGNGGETVEENPVFETKYR